MKLVFRTALIFFALTIPSISWAYCSGSTTKKCTNYDAVTTLLLKGDYQAIWKYLGHPFSVSRYHIRKPYKQEEFKKLKVDTKRFIEIAGPLVKNKPDLAFYVGTAIRFGRWASYASGRKLQEQNNIYRSQVSFFELALRSDNSIIKMKSAEILGDINYNGALSPGLNSVFVSTNDKKATKYYSMCGDLCVEKFITSFLISSDHVEGLKFLKNLRGFPKSRTNENFRQILAAEKKYKNLWAIYKFGLFGENKNDKVANNYYTLLRKGIGAEPNFKNNADTGEDLFWLASQFTSDRGGFLTLTRPYFPQSPEVELKLLRRAASKKHAKAAKKLHEKYRIGGGVRKDFLRSYAYLNLAIEFEKNQKERKVNHELLEWYERKWQLTTSQIIHAQQMSGKILRELKESKQEKRKPKLINGTGFFVSNAGHIITNHHVVSNCKTVTISHEGNKKEASLIVEDARNDVALLKTEKVSIVAFIRGGRGIRQGDDIVTYGFPLSGILSSSAKVTSGTVNSLSGMKNDFRYMQISAPIQPGNSGGPLLDKGGNVVGIVTAKLNASAIQKITGDIPQNVNFALKSSVIKDILDANAINYKTRPFREEIRTSTIASNASRFVVKIRCEK